jgi:hypothetical protein
MIWINGTVTLLDQDESIEPEEEAGNALTGEGQARKGNWGVFASGIRGAAIRSWFTQRPLRDLRGPVSR